MIRVLVAEDHTIVREGIKQLIGLAKDLQVAGEACNGEQLLETLRHTPCEVVLLDISMPGVNGLEAIPRIRALTHPPAVLVLSMHDEAQMAARALKIGAAGYATKDSDPALLLTAIRKVAAGGRYIDPELADRMVFEVGLTDSRPMTRCLPLIGSTRLKYVILVSRYRPSRISSAIRSASRSRSGWVSRKRVTSRRDRLPLR